MALLKDVAAACGLSLTTVSDALRGKGSVSEKTRQRVREVADRLGYQPDPLASGLRARRFSRASTHQGLPIVITQVPPAGDHIGAHLTRIGKSLGYACRFENLPTLPEALRATLQRWHRQGVVGVVFRGLSPVVKVDLPEWRRFALVACTGAGMPPPCHNIGTDAVQAVDTCVRVLRGRGYKAIGLAISSHRVELADDRRRYASALLALAEIAPDERLVPVFRGSFMVPENRAALAAWFERNRPDAVVGFNHLIRLWLEESGWRCPRDFAFATLHHIPAFPDEAGHDPMHEECCRATLELLDGLVRYRETGWPKHPRRTLVESGWVDGATAPVAGALRSERV